VFQLHQAAERLYVTASLVFTGYKRKEHSLQKLHEEAAPMHPDIAAVLPRTTPEPTRERLPGIINRPFVTVSARASAPSSFWSEAMRREIDPEIADSARPEGRRLRPALNFHASVTTCVTMRDHRPSKIRMTDPLLHTPALE
jgi:hypothetical protein